MLFVAINFKTRSLTALLAILTLLCIATTNCQASAKLQGVVKMEQLGGTPMAQIVISSPDAGGPTTTDANGRFVLAFPRLNPGDRTQLDVKFKGWVVVNYEQIIGVTLPSDARANPITILLAQNGERERWALQYYNLKLKTLNDAKYTLKIQELEQKRQVTAQERNALELERDQAQKQIKGLADELAALKPAKGDALYLQAAQMLLSNQQDKALALLDESKLQANINQIQKQEEDIRRLREETARNYRLRGQLLAMRFQNDQAAQAFLAATQLLPHDIATWSAFALFHQQLKHFPEALQGYEKVLDLTRSLASSAPNSYESNVAAILTTMGSIYSDLKRYDKARESYEEGLKIYRNQAHIKPDAYRQNVVSTLTSLAAVYSAQQDHDEEFVILQEALGIYRDLYRNAPNSNDNQISVARTLRNLAPLYRAKSRYGEAIKAYEEALGIYRSYGANDRSGQYFVGLILCELGGLHREQKHYDEADKCYRESLKILQTNGYGGSLPDVFIGIGDLARDLKHYDDARKNYEEALRILRGFAVRDHKIESKVLLVQANLDGLPSSNNLHVQ